MAFDIGHRWGADLDVSPTGDLAIVEGAPAATQRILRRLLTNLGDYIWNPTYGAGLTQFVGMPTQSRQIAAIVRSQMLQEAGVARLPTPEITVANPEGLGVGTFELSIRYKIEAGDGGCQDRNGACSYIANGPGALCYDR